MKKQVEGKKREASYAGTYDTGEEIELKAHYSFFGSTFDLEEIAGVLEAMRGDTLTMGSQVTLFQNEFAKYCGCKYAFATSSCTAALHISTQLFNLKPGDEVITTPITFIATNLPILKAGAVPVFADVDNRTLNIDPNKVEYLVTKRTKAIYVTHMCGQMVDMDPILQIADKYNLLVLEDAAHAAGAQYKGKMAGTIGNVGNFSFHSVKNMTTAEGGMITTDNDEYAKKIPILRCISIKDYEDQEDYWLPYHYDIVSIDSHLGNNYRMDEIRAAIGRAQLRKLDENNKKRREFAHYMSAKLKDVEGVTVPYEDPNGYHIYHIYNLLVDTKALGINRDDFIRILYRKEGIHVVFHYKPSYLFSIYEERGYEPGLCPIAEDAFFNKLVHVPIHPRLTIAEMDAIVGGIKNAIIRAQHGEKGY